MSTEEDITPTDSSPAEEASPTSATAPDDGPNIPSPQTEQSSTGGDPPTRSEDTPTSPTARDAPSAGEAGTGDTASAVQPAPVVGGEVRKVELLLKPAGDAPILKQRKFLIDDGRNVVWIAGFIRKYLKMTGDESLFVYVNQSFAPAPDALIRNLYECFGSDNRLVLHYSKTQAWG